MQIFKDCDATNTERCGFDKANTGTAEGSLVTGAEEIKPAMNSNPLFVYSVRTQRAKKSGRLDCTHTASRGRPFGHGGRHGRAAASHPGGGSSGWS